MHQILELFLRTSFPAHIESCDCEDNFMLSKLTYQGVVISGFAELQMDQLDVVDSFGTVPFLDYKHFALRTFFPEVNSC